MKKAPFFYSMDVLAHKLIPIENAAGTGERFLRDFEREFASMGVPDFFVEPIRVGYLDWDPEERLGLSVQYTKIQFHYHLYVTTQDVGPNLEVAIHHVSENGGLTIPPKEPLAGWFKVVLMAVNEVIRAEEADPYKKRLRQLLRSGGDPLSFW